MRSPFFASEGGLLSEQVWDSADIPERELVFSKPSGSAMPLVWAHAEYVKLSRSLADNRVFDTPPQPVARYRSGTFESPYASWRFNQKCQTMMIGRLLRIEVLQPAVVHWTCDKWQTVLDFETRDSGLGLYLVDLPTSELPVGTGVQFTFRWPLAERWEGVDFAVNILDSMQPADSIRRFP